MSNSPLSLGRRAVLAGLAGGAAALTLPRTALAFSVERARAMIDNVVRDINKIIGSGKSEAGMIKDFEKLFSTYGDVPRIAALVLGPDGRTASSSQRSAFAKAFQGYMSRKYGRRFREFIGGSIEVQGAKAVKSFYEVTTMTRLKGRAPFEVVFVVADKNGKFIDMKIEGISLVKSERSEIGALLDKRKGDLNRLIADLKKI
ncbi:ABC transporter substrate-binding protein [Aliiroseovarius subalbicans]|uniref:MlaC/ttg2D family ABC transporter substrate-binding protein n=1 Tax=Aliiroseovarius subalbicans TaxID=2925840 RepID=UPI001F565D82|nr:ABC transporter substrate-binding protein [Aliiroseovarius subalbicans]MCI2399475.1 ABC transporter substrate-binding protein [Aliiroseovarius subalbicans]